MKEPPSGLTVRPLEIRLNNESSLTKPPLPILFASRHTVQVAGAWILSHAFWHYDYSSDVEFWAKKGYPMLKSHATFWLQNLFEDTYSNDGTLVAAPCNSPENPVFVNGTFGCAIFQQTIVELFQFVLRGAQNGNETDEGFLADVRDKLGRLDRGAHIGSWGQVRFFLFFFVLFCFFE